MSKKSEEQKKEQLSEEQKKAQEKTDYKNAKEQENKTEEQEIDQQEEKEEKKEPTAEDKLQQMEDKYLRLVAEYDNYRKRTLREKMELSKSAGEDILIGLLPVVDDFERALGHIDEANDLKAVKEGIDLIYGKFKEFLKQKGVKEIEANHQEFDTDLHEAMTKIPAPEEKLKGKVLDVLEKGYTLQDKVIRYSKVVVGE